MSRYKTVETYVDVEVDLDEWTDEELLEELRSRNVETDETDSPDIVNAILWYERGNIKETLHYLEMAFPELNGLSEKVKNEFS